VTAAATIAPIRGRCWVIPDEYVNTDQIMPHAGYELPPAQQEALVLANVRPGWAGMVREGDILVTGRAFGTGSSRPAPTMFLRLGIRALLSESIGEVFFRNCVSYALPAMELPGVLDLVTEGDELSVDIATGGFENLTSGARVQGEPMPPMLLETIAAGGVHAMLRSKGYM
jgi:3-isopropylmalate/(R)-2-methylmalate dehydratase small subunit